jgi:hypothetical protein
MSSLAHPLPRRARTVTTEEAAQSLWGMRQLLRAGSMDGHAALTTLELLCRHRNPRIAALAAETGCDVADRFPALGVFAR